MKDAIPNSDFTTDHPASDIPFIFRRRLNWGDSDTAEIGYVSKFIDFCQEAIEVWWEAILAINWYQLKKINLANPAVGLNIDFLKPVVVGDRMDIVVLIEKLGKTSITYKIEGHKVDGPLCFTGTFNHVLVTGVESENIAPAKFPVGWRNLIEGYQRECKLRSHGVKTKREVLNFWFGPPGSEMRGKKRSEWTLNNTVKKNAFEREIRNHFMPSYEAAARGDLDHWGCSSDGILALCILMDQIPRNMFRGSRKEFATDHKILSLVNKAISLKLDSKLDVIPATFLYLPFTHSEKINDQITFLKFAELWTKHPKGSELLRSGYSNMETIKTFGRFPERNEALGRRSTADENDYLELIRPVTFDNKE